MDFLLKKQRSLQTEFLDLANEARELYLPEEVPFLRYTPTSMEFFRDYVSKNLPVVVDCDHLGWEAFTRWNDSSYLVSTLNDKTITVAITPTGYADAPLDEDTFVLPHEINMTFSRFIKILENPQDHHGIYYIQKQNSNFLEEFQELIPDAGTDIHWASEAFGKLPDAVNFWMGDKRAVTSMHKDHYENLYVVVKGSKTFTLHPPTDLPFIPYKMYTMAKYVMKKEGEFEIIELENSQDISEYDEEKEESTGGSPGEGKQTEGIDSISSACTSSISDSNSREVNSHGQTSCMQNGDGCSHIKKQRVPWIAVDPLDPDLEKYPYYSKTKPIKCTVSAGQMLYLPSLWFHHVTQSHGTIAVNFWYDMEFDIKYNYFKFVESLTRSHAFIDER